MTIKLAVISTAKNTTKALEDIKVLAGDALEIVLHLGDKNAPYKASSLSRLKASYGTDGHLMEDSTYSGAAKDFILSDEYFAQRDVFSDHMMRTAERFKHKSHPLQDQQDYHDYHHILVDTLAKKLKDSGATHCLFFNIPHLGYDTALHQVAKALGLKIIIVTQSLFPNRFFSVEDPGDYGNLSIDPAHPPFEIEKGSKPDLFYMKGIKQEREAGGRVTAMAVLQLMTFLAIKRPLQAFNPIYLWKTLTRMKRIYGALPKWRDPFGVFFHENEFEYFEHLASYEDQEVDLNGDFVYFPLHVQPEMTTASLSHRFRDQAYAIERLADMLPDGVRILVKENPKQGACMRGPLFFHRLKRIPSVTILPSWADTNALEASAKFVATITGTAGWEAVRSGTPALVFGKAWYRKMPGVFEFSENVTYDQIINTKIDHAELQQAAGSMVAKAHKGVVDRHYVAMIDDAKTTQDVDNGAEVIWSLIKGETPFTFDTEPQPANIT
ncbi:MAG: capsular polysaccharide export protein, LipB/KpsS family [Cognatishimia sp.]|uniref:capsular polysaccharide export protein, LipB/KpsS family n=1 Tax=Cognatishimia sp. TaxID=2211648 RepID=UPI00405962E1